MKGEKRGGEEEWEQFLMNSMATNCSTVHLESMRGNDCKDKIITRSLAPACAASVPTRTSHTLQKRSCHEGVVPVYSVKDNGFVTIDMASQWHHS